jgi:glyoxylase-like metal-dependent hydrolase (beta-lactamase superfamily II)
VIEAAGKLLAFADDKTVIIPGHGNITDRAGLERYHQMLIAVYERAGQLVANGKSLEEILAANVTKEFDDEFNGFISNEAFIGIVYRDLTSGE